MEPPTNEDLFTWYNQWKAGRSKNDIERRELDKPQAHGKLITRLWRERFNIETEGVHPLVTENQRLRELLETHGIDPKED
jgi:hypothetical protein